MYNIPRPLYLLKQSQKLCRLHAPTKQENSILVTLTSTKDTPNLEVMYTGVPVHGPDFEGHVVAAGGQELALRVPLDRVHLVGVT